MQLYMSYKELYKKSIFILVIITKLTCFNSLNKIKIGLGYDFKTSYMFNLGLYFKNNLITQINKLTGTQKAESQNFVDLTFSKSNSLFNLGSKI